MNAPRRSVAMLLKEFDITGSFKNCPLSFTSLASGAR